MIGASMNTIILKSNLKISRDYIVLRLQLARAFKVHIQISLPKLSELTSFPREIIRKP